MIEHYDYINKMRGTKYIVSFVAYNQSARLSWPGASS